MRRWSTFGVLQLASVREVRLKGGKRDEADTLPAALTADEVLEEVLSLFNLQCSAPEFKLGVNGAYKAVGVLMDELQKQLHPPINTLDLTVRKSSILDQQRKFFPPTAKVVPSPVEEGETMMSDDSSVPNSTLPSSSLTSTSTDGSISLVSYLTRSLFPANALPKETPNWSAIAPTIQQPTGSFVADRYFPVTNTFLSNLFARGLPSPAPGIDMEPYLKDSRAELGTLLEGLIHTYSYSHQIKLQWKRRVMAIGANLGSKVERSHPIFLAAPYQIAHPNDHINRIQVLQVYVNGEPIMKDPSPTEAAPPEADRTAARKAIKDRIKECEEAWDAKPAAHVWPEGHEPSFIIGVELLVGVVTPPQRFNPDVEFYTGKIELPEYAMKDGPLSPFTRASQTAVAAFMASTTSTRILRAANTIHQLFTGRDMRVPFGVILSKLSQLGDPRAVQGTGLFLAHKYALLDNDDQANPGVATDNPKDPAPIPPSEDQKVFESIVGKPGQFPVQVKRVGMVYLPTQGEWLVDLIEPEV